MIHNATLSSLALNEGSSYQIQSGKKLDSLFFFFSLSDLCLRRHRLQSSEEEEEASFIATSLGLLGQQTTPPANCYV
jgi:hypothetical protein